MILLVSAKGAKTYYVYRKLDGRPEKIKLGSFHDLSIENARAAAAKVNSQIGQGKNPNEIKRKLKEEPTFQEMAERFMDSKRTRSGKPLSPRTTEEYGKLLKTHLAKIAKLHLTQITTDRLKSLKIASNSQNNKVRAFISSVFNWAASEGLTTAKNPATAIKTRFVPSRERFLQPEEMERFFNAVEQSHLRDFYLLSLYTGQRRENVMAMQWKELDLSQAVWNIPKTKNGESHRLPLIPEAVEILTNRKHQKVVNCQWVFPAESKSGHIVNVAKEWRKVLVVAGLENLRIHDLRRTLGSWQAIQGTSLTIIGKGLGHKSQQSTGIYSRLTLDPVKDAMGSAVIEMHKAGNRKK